jgi:hypothetical protein
MWQTILKGSKADAMSAQKVADHLKTLEKISNVRPCQLTIGRRTYVGASYSLESGESCFYLLMNELPPFYKRKEVLLIDGKEWYLAHYYDEGEKDQYHPFGNEFGLFAWNEWVKEPIDHYDVVKRKRIKVKVEYLDAV